MNEVKKPVERVSQRRLRSIARPDDRLLEHVPYAGAWRCGGAEKMPSSGSPTRTGLSAGKATRCGADT